MALRGQNFGVFSALKVDPQTAFSPLVSRGSPTQIRVHFRPTLYNSIKFYVTLTFPSVLKYVKAMLIINIEPKIMAWIKKYVVNIHIKMKLVKLQVGSTTGFCQYMPILDSGNYGKWYVKKCVNNKLVIFIGITGLFV